MHPCSSLTTAVIESRSIISSILGRKARAYCASRLYLNQYFFKLICAFKSHISTAFYHDTSLCILNKIQILLLTALSKQIPDFLVVYLHSSQFEQEFPFWILLYGWEDVSCSQSDDVAHSVRLSRTCLSVAEQSCIESLQQIIGISICLLLAFRCASIQSSPIWQKAYRSKGSKCWYSLQNSSCKGKVYWPLTPWRLLTWVKNAVRPRTNAHAVDYNQVSKLKRRIRFFCADLV